MGIWKIDGLRNDYKGRKYEEEFNVNLYVRKIGWIGVQLNVEITPIFCMNCSRQLDGFFKHDGSRYGQVGNVKCNHCGSMIICTDHDNIVDELMVHFNNGKEYIINYYKLYGIEQGVWISLKEKTGYDIFAKHNNNEWVTLQKVIEEICTHCNIRLKDIKVENIVTDNKIKLLPNVVNKWLSLIFSLGICI